jgi:hypothetical protein
MTFDRKLGFFFGVHLRNSMIEEMFAVASIDSL